MGDHLESNRISADVPGTTCSSNTTVNAALPQPPPLSSSSSASNSTSVSAVTTSSPSLRRSSASMVQKASPKQECTNDVAVAGFGGAASSVPKASASTRWQDKTMRGRNKNERDDWKKMKKMKIDKYDDFKEWIDGELTLRYRPSDIDARKHLSGWAMRNTNNHNKKVLKKSCLGVFVCSNNCHTSQGEIVTVRPATSDRARRKQADKKCPRTGCDGKLRHLVCSGKNGYPVTHFWRVTDTVILFQSKGIHDHPRPDVVKTTSVAKMALLEYHRNHRHERPKEICRKVNCQSTHQTFGDRHTFTLQRSTQNNGVHIHKSFNRVDRVARQLREVQNTEPEPDEMPKKEPYTLRSHLRSLWGNTAQRATDMDNHHHHQFGNGQGPLQTTYNGRQTFGTYYPTQSQVDEWSQYSSSQEEYAPYPGYRTTEGQHATGTCYQPTGYAPFGTSVHAADGTTYDYTFSGHGNVVIAPSAGTPKNHESMDTSDVHNDVTKQGLTAYHSDVTKQGMTAYHSYPADLNLMLTNQPGSVDDTSVLPSYVGHDASHHQQTHTLINLVQQTGQAPVKRPAPPDLHSLQEAKQPRLCGQRESTTETSTIKLAEHTPSINIDLSNFSDIFDMGSGLGEEGLAGRPKSPVYQTLSPEPNVQSNIAGTPKKGDKGCSGEEPHDSASGMSDVEVQHTRASGESSVSSPVGSETSHISDPHSSPPQSPPNPPVLTQLSTHAPTNVPVTTAAGTNEDGNFLDQLVSMYLKDEKPISTLKSEFHVYTDSPSSHRAFAYRSSDQAHMSAALEHFKSPSGHGGHYDYSWYDRSQSYRSANGPVPVTDGIVNPLVPGTFDYTTSITDYYNSHTAAAAAAAAATVATSDSSQAVLSHNSHSSAPTSSSVFGHVTGRHVF